MVDFRRNRFFILYSLLCTSGLHRNNIITSSCIATFLYMRLKFFDRADDHHPLLSLSKRTQERMPSGSCDIFVYQGPRGESKC